MQVPLLFFNATRDSNTGTIYVKVVNRAGTGLPVHVAISGLSAVEPKGKAITLAASGPNDTNTITEPAKIVPVTSDVNGLGADFTRTFPPYSITVFEMTGKWSLSWRGGGLMGRGAARWRGGGGAGVRRRVSWRCRAFLGWSPSDRPERRQDAAPPRSAGGLPEPCSLNAPP